MIRQLRKLGDPVLRRISESVDDKELESQWLTDLIQDMIETMRATGGVGLAAPQVGIAKRVFVLEVAEAAYVRRKKAYYGLTGPVPLEIWINPEMEVLDAELIDNREGCLSIDGYLGWIERYEKVKIQGLNQAGISKAQHAAGFHAKIIQHELDHLNGLLYIDRTPQVFRAEPSDTLGSRYAELQPPGR